MASTLDTTGEQAPIVNRGHGIAALGPSDTSDTGSDVVGHSGIGADQRANQLTDVSMYDEGDEYSLTAGPDLGDSDLDSDSDASGTGERKAAGRDAGVVVGQDIAPDHIEYIEDIYDAEDEESDD